MRVHSASCTTSSSYEYSRGPAVSEQLHAPSSAGRKSMHIYRLVAGASALRVRPRSPLTCANINNPRADKIVSSDRVWHTAARTIRQRMATGLQVKVYTRTARASFFLTSKLSWPQAPSFAHLLSTTHDLAFFVSRVSPNFMLGTYMHDFPSLPSTSSEVPPPTYQHATLMCGSPRDHSIA